MKHKTLNTKAEKQNRPGIKTDVRKTKKKWVPQHKHFEGSVGEGQGFAFKRKAKAKHEYNKLLRKEKKKLSVPKNLYKDEYPEHLKHLYLAEKEKLKKEALTNRVNRSKERMKEKEEEETHDILDASQLDLDTQNPSVSEETELNQNETKPTDTSVKEQLMSIPISNRMRKKQQKKTSYQKTQEEFERKREHQRKKQEEYQKNKQQREEAMQRYKQKKMDTYQILSKKTKKGQPNLNLQMEYLLQKIQRTEK